MAICRFCGKSYEDTLEDHLRNTHTFDDGQLAKNFAIIDKRLEELEKS